MIDFVCGISLRFMCVSWKIWPSLVCRFPVSYVDVDVACLVSSMRGTIDVPCSFALSSMF